MRSINRKRLSKAISVRANNGLLHQYDDGIPLLKPISCGRDGQAPIIIKLPSLREEAFAIADQQTNAHKEGHAWGDMAILCTDWETMDICADALHQRRLPLVSANAQATTTPAQTPYNS